MKRKRWLILGIVIVGLAYLATSAYTRLGNRSFARIQEAERTKKQTLRAVFAERHLPFPPKRIFLRAFKQERVLEIWAATAKGNQLELVKSYPIVGMSGSLGPKRREGDLQVPEGFYYIDRFNPNSRFHLSLGLNYPNASDRILSDKKSPGSDIFIHGDRVSIGCLAMENDPIEEIYLMALSAKTSGQTRIPVHIFPTRLDLHGMAKLHSAYHDQPKLISFWESLVPGYTKFEKSRQVYTPKVRKDGLYQF